VSLSSLLARELSGHGSDVALRSLAVRFLNSTRRPINASSLSTRLPSEKRGSFSHERLTPQLPPKGLMALLSHRQSRLVGGVLLATLFVALLVSYRPNPSSVGAEPAGWSSASVSPMAGASKEAQTTPVLEDVLVPVMDHGRFVGPETRFLRGVAGYCKIPPADTL
jgi:hypothetical protein